MRLGLLACTLAIAACTSASVNVPTSGAGPQPPKQAAVSLYRFAGSRQCMPGGLTPAEARKSLNEGGIEVLSAACGTDGRVHAATCGASDGRIVIVDVRAGQERAARERGYAPLADLAEARRTPCP